MKTYAHILVLAAGLFAHSIACAAGSSLEIILSDDHVTFATTTNISLERVFRNVGETNMNPMSLLRELRVVFDGKEYARDPKKVFFYNGVMFFQPGLGWRDHVSLSDYFIPAASLTPGKHTVSLKYGDSVSNQLTIFIRTQR